MFSEIPLALDTAATPPRPSTRASEAAHIRRPRSLSSGANAKPLTNQALIDHAPGVLRAGTTILHFIYLHILTVGTPGNYMVYTGYDDDAPAASTGFVVPATHTLRVAKRGAAANQGVVTVRATEQRPFGPITEPVSLVSDGSDADFTRYVLQGTIVTADIGVNEVPPDRCVTWKAGVSGGQDDITHDGTKWTFPMNGYRGMTVTFEPAPCSGFFAPQQRVPDPTASSFAPTVAAFDGRLYMAWHGPGRDDAIYWSSFDGTHWSDEQRMPDPTASSLGPSLAAFNGRLYMAWITAGNDNSMYWASFDGTRWSEQQKLPFPGNLAPALAVFNGRLYVAWHGPGYDESIYWASFDGTQWSEQQKLAAPTATAFGPSLAVSSGRLFMAWRGPMDDEALYWASFDGSQWSDQQRLPDPVASRFQPSLAAYDGQLYMAWRGSALDEAIWWSSFDGNRWSDQHRVSDPVASHTWPSLAAYDGRLYMAWRGSLTDQAIWWTSSVLRAPGYSALPTISGSMTEGQLLTAAEGGWTGLPDSFSYQWEDCDGAGNNCSVIPGATGHTYVLTSNEVDHTIRVQVTANNSVGSSIPATSAPTSLVAPLAPPVPASTALPGISGTAQEGQTLSETHGTWTNNPTGFAYQWLRCDSAGSNCGPLSDATAQTYVPTADDVGHTLQVQETASNQAGPSDPTASANTATVVGQVTINGTSTSVRVGCTGTATCTVNATLTTIETIEHGQPVAITAKRANVKNKVIVLGSTTVAIRGGQVDTIVIPLNSNAKRLLSTHPRLNAKLTITEAAAGKTSTVVAKTITLRIPRRRIVYGQSIDLAVAVASGTVTHRRLDLVRRMVVAGRPSGWYRVTTVWTDGRGVAHVKDHPGG